MQANGDDKDNQVECVRLTILEIPLLHKHKDVSKIVIMLFRLMIVAFVLSYSLNRITSDYKRQEACGALVQILSFVDDKKEIDHRNCVNH